MNPNNHFKCVSLQNELYIARILLNYWWLTWFCKFFFPLSSSSYIKQMLDPMLTSSFPVLFINSNQSFASIPFLIFIHYFKLNDHSQHTVNNHCSYLFHFLLTTLLKFKCITNNSRVTLTSQRNTNKTVGHHFTIIQIY